MIKIVKSMRVEGLEKLAAMLGTSKWHLSRVIHGKRKSKRLADALLEHGIRVAKYKGE
jgi:hypothetical protein